MLRVSLRQLLAKDSEFFNIPTSTFDLTLRPEQLTIPQFVELTNLVAAAQSETPKE
jgi:hypothetical protein